MTARELHDKLHPPTPEEALRVAQAYLDEGDLPESIWYELGFVQETSREQARVWNDLLALRQAHFELQGKTAPPYTQTWR